MTSTSSPPPSSKVAPSSAQVTSSSSATSITAKPSTAGPQAAAGQDASGRQPPTSAAAAAELASIKISLYGKLRHFPDFPIPGIDFIDIMPLFLDPESHASLLRGLELQVAQFCAAAAAAGFQGGHPDVVVGLDARGFLFGPALALRIGAAFVPVRKKGKLPGPCVTASYEKEYGADYFQMQEGAIRPGQRVLVVDDIIATGGSAAAAGELVHQLGGDLIGYLFMLEIAPLKGKEKLGGKPMVTLLQEVDY